MPTALSRAESSNIAPMMQIEHGSTSSSLFARSSLELLWFRKDESKAGIRAEKTGQNLSGLPKTGVGHRTHELLSRESNSIRGWGNDDSRRSKNKKDKIRSLDFLAPKATAVPYASRGAFEMTTSGAEPK
jgi:hypothetical protein